MDMRTSPLLTDLYQLTMLHGYFEYGMNDTAVFELMVRSLPERRGFLVASGLEPVLEFLEDLRFGEEELRWASESGRFTREFVEFLGNLRFTGDVHAMPEGTIFFPDEPVLRVTAPLAEAQLVESRVLNLVHASTLIASKAVRCVLAAPGKLLVDFGMRRAHGAEAGLLAARAAYQAGFAGSATVQAEPEYGVPVFGTMAHSFIQAHEDEATAFEHFATAQPDNVVLLIDTYDTEDGAREVVKLAPRLDDLGITIRGVRLDSGDLVEHSKAVRRILDDAGLEGVTIFSSGGLDELEVERLLADGAEIDGFGIGTKLDTSADAPYLDCAYKLQEYAGLARRKRSEGKSTWPGRKQVYRRVEGGRMVGDTLSLEEDEHPGKPLIVPVMLRGERIDPPEPLQRSRARVAEQIELLPLELRSLREAPEYPVEVAKRLRDLADEVDRRVDRLRG